MKRMAAVALLLLFLNSLQEVKADDSPKPVKVSGELQQLQDIIYQQGTALAELQTDIKYKEEENKEQVKELLAMKTELGNLKKVTSELLFMKTELENLKNLTSRRRKVAFSAAIGLPEGMRGPYSAEVTLIYTNVLTNIGKAYNPATGIFTAPFKGVYYIRFTASEYGNNRNNMGLNLYKNGKHLLHLGENSVDGIAKHVSSGLTMELEEGDVIYTRLPVNYVIWDDHLFRSSFSGFLLFHL